MEPKREFTIKLRFGAQTRNPSNAEIFKFFNKQGWTSEDLSAMYRDDHSVFVRFKTEPMMRGALTSLGPQVKFDYDDGTSVEVKVQAAAGTFKYVRIFGLPPEVDDRHIVTVMSKYGAIQQLVRERYPVETGFPIWNGVRGLHIELVAEIPAQLTIQHCKARIYYDGLQNKCFGCGALDHLKAACPKRSSVNQRLVAAGKPIVNPAAPPATPPIATTAGTQAGPPVAVSFASIVANGTPVNPVDAPSTSGMVVLNPKTPAPQSQPNLESSNHVEKPSLERASSCPQLPSAAEESGEESMDEVDEIQQKKEEALPTDATPMETDGVWTEAKGTVKKVKGKRGRPKKQAESDTSDADARGGKQFIVPAPGVDLLAAQAMPKPERPQTRSASEQRMPTNNK